MKDPRYTGIRAKIELGLLLLGILAFVCSCPIICENGRQKVLQIEAATKQKHEQALRGEYNAWVKLTDNPKKLTFRQWSNLPRNPWTGAIQR